MQQSALVFSCIALMLLSAGLFSLQTEVGRRRRAEVSLREKSLLVEAIVDGTGDAVFVKDTAGRYVLVNRAAARLVGRAPEDVVGADDGALYSAGTTAARSEADRAVMREGETKVLEERVETADGKQRVLSTVRSPYRDPSGATLGVIGISRDVTERKEAEEARLNEIGLLLQMGELLQACRTTDEAYDVIAQLAPRFFTHESGAIGLFHPSRNILEARVRWGELEVLREPPLFGPDDCWALRRGQMHLVEHGGAGVSCRHSIAEGTRSMLCVPLAAQGEVLGILHLASNEPLTLDQRRRARVVCEQISMALANLQLRETLRNQSIRDPLTGLFNRRYAEETLPRELLRSAREGSALSVLMLDVDFFKKVNDTYGHDAGDLVLKKVAAELQSLVRGSDFVSRLGGEELMVALPGSNGENAKAKAETLREAIARLDVSHAGRPIKVTVSIGVASAGNAARADELMHRADLALYRAKNEGRNRVVAA
jgi:diguanylate cyclase (GGDEF)-like protein/PAS domain S-box-containing protein